MESSPGQDERNKVQIADLKNELAKRDGIKKHNFKKVFYLLWVIIFYLLSQQKPWRIDQKNC